MNVFETGTGDKALRTSGWETNLVRACDSLQKKSLISWDYQGKFAENRPISLDFHGNNYLGRTSPKNSL